MQRDRHRVILPAWSPAARMIAVLRRELAETMRERNDLRAALEELSATVRARWEAEAEVRRLRHAREIERAARAERPAGTPLH